MFDGAFLEVVQDLVADDAVGDRSDLLEIVDIEITHAKRSDLAITI